MSQRRQFTSVFKGKVALEAIREVNTLAEIAQKYEIHAKQVSSWKKEALQSMNTLFQDKGKKDNRIKEIESENEQLFKTVGKLTMQRDWLKKKSIELGLL